MTRPKKPDNGPVRAYATYVRIGIIGVGVLLQLGLLGLVTYYLQAYTAALYLLMDVAGLVTVFCLINRHDSSAYRMAWIIVILVAPVFGLLLYFLPGAGRFQPPGTGGAAPKGVRPRVCPAFGGPGAGGFPADASGNRRPTQ